MLQPKNSATRAHNVLDAINCDLQQAQELFSFKDGYKSATTPTERVTLKASLEMFSERLLGDDYQVSNEGFKETIIDGFKAIVEKLRAIFTYIVDFYKNYLVNNVKNIERLIGKIGNNPNIKLDKSLVVEHLSLYGYAYTEKLDGKNVAALRKFVSPVKNIIPISVEVVRLMIEVNKTVKSQITKDKASALSGSITKIVEMISAMNCEVKPTILEDSGKISFNKVAASKKFHDSYPREESACVVNVPGLISSFGNFKADNDLASKNIRDFDNFIRNLDEVVKSISKSQVKSDSSYSSTDYLIQVMRLSSVAIEFQKYYMESLNQSVRFNTMIAKALANEYLDSFVSVDDQSVAAKFKGVKVHFGNESEGEEVPVISGLSVSEDDEMLDYDETDLTDLVDQKSDLEEKDSIDVLTEIDTSFANLEASLEAFPAVIDQPEAEPSKTKEALSKFAEKIVEMLKSISKWILEKVVEFSSFLHKTLNPKVKRLEQIRQFIMLSTLFDKRDIELKFTNKATPYGVFNNKGVLIPEQIRTRVKYATLTVKEVANLIKNLKDISIKKISNGTAELTPEIKSLVEVINKNFQQYVDSFKDTGLEFNLQEFYSKDDPVLPMFSVTNSNDSEVVVVKNAALTELSRGVGGATGFNDIKALHGLLTSSATSIVGLKAELTFSGSVESIKNAFNGKSKEEISEITKSMNYLKTCVSRILHMLFHFDKTFVYFTDSLFRVAYELYSNKAVDLTSDASGAIKKAMSNIKFGKEEFPELNNLVISIESALEKGGLNRDEAIAINLSSRFLKDSFGIEDFTIDPDLFIDPKHRKDFTQLYLNKLSDI